VEFFEFEKEPENIRGWVGWLVVGVDGRRCYVGIDENEKKCSREKSSSSSGV